jgi:hypothetical protein
MTRSDNISTVPLARDVFIAAHRQKPSGAFFGLIVAGLFAVGCMRTTFRSGRMPGDAPTDWNHRWHHSFLFGQLECPGAIEPSRACPLGWAELELEQDPLQTTVSLLTLGVYTPSTVTVVCEAKESLPK